MGTIEHKTFPKGILLMQFAITLLTGILLPCNMKAQKYEGWRQNGNYGMKAEGSEEWCVPPMYEQTWGHNKAESPIFLVKRGEYYGFIDEDNNTVLPFVYTDATCFFNRLATVQNADDSLYYAIDLKGKVVSKGYKNLSGGIGIFFGEDTDGKRYLFDKALQPRNNKAYEKLVFQTVRVGNATYQFFLVKDNGLWGIVDAMGGEILPCVYNSIEPDYPTSVASISDKIRENKLTYADFPLLFMASKAISVDKKTGRKDIRYGLISMQGEELIPFKQYGKAGVKVEHEKCWKKKLLPYAQNKDNVLAWAESRLKPVADKLITEATQLTASHPADYNHPAFPELKIKGNKGNMTLMDGNKNPAEKSFYSITAGDRYFISQDKNGHYGLLDRYGREALPCEYDSITVFRAMEKGGDLLLLQKDGKKGIAWTDGSLMLPCWYDNIEQIPGYHVFMADDGNSYRAYKYTGVPRHVYSYDAYHYDAATGKVTVDYGNGLISRPMDKLGYDDMSRQIWLLGYNSKEPDKKLYYYLKAYEAADDPNSDMTLLILRLIGSFYKEAGDNESARKYLGIAASHGDEGAKNMLGSIDFEEKYGKLEMPSLLDIASGLLNTISSIRSGNVTSGGTATSAGGAVASENVASGRDASYYQSMYNRWDNRAKELYEDLTSRGSRRTKNGTAVSGSSGGYWNGAAYRGMKQNLREAQRNMKRIRMEAKAAGHTISKSNYETVQVSY